MFQRVFGRIWVILQLHVDHIEITWATLVTNAAWYNQAACNRILPCATHAEMPVQHTCLPAVRSGCACQPRKCYVSDRRLFHPCILRLIYSEYQLDLIRSVLTVPSHHKFHHLPHGCWNRVLVELTLFRGIGEGRSCGGLSILQEGVSGNVL